MGARYRGGFAALAAWAVAAAAWAPAPAAAAASPGPPDLCAPCLSPSSCFAGVCVPDGSGAGTGTCSQRCDPANNDSCPDQFVCDKVEGEPQPICKPGSVKLCQGLYQGAARNNICSLPAAVSGDKANLQRPCQDGLSCFTLAVDKVGYCLPSCTRNDPNIQCKEVGATCCYAQDDSDGSCLTEVPRVVNGSCFFLRRAGETCTVAEQSLCVAGSSCLSPSADPALRRCYQNCSDGGGCPAKGVCATFSGGKVCCDQDLFDGVNSATCQPAVAVRLRLVGVACDTNEQCASKLCHKSPMGGVCSQPCQTSTDCTAITTDVNGDGKADGGTSCLTVSAGTNLCLPNGQIAPPSADTIDSSGTSNRSSGPPGGSGCGSGAAAADPSAALAAAWAALRGGRRRRGRSPAPPPRRA